MSLIDVRSFGAKPDDPTFDNAPAIMSALRKQRAGKGVDTVLLPDTLSGTPSTYWCKSSILHDNAGFNATIQGGGKTKVKFAPNVPISTFRSTSGDLQGKHLAAIGNYGALTMLDVGFDFNGAQQLVLDAAGQPTMVGDTLRITGAKTVRATNVPTYNQRGLTTRSSVNMPETFAFQLLHVADFVLDGCHQISLDGAPTATGIVAHWSSGVIKNTFTGNVRGQGFGTYGNCKVTYESCWADGVGHAYNLEGGNIGPQDIVIGKAGDPTKDCYSTNSRAALAMNGNPTAINSLSVEGLHSTNDRTVFIGTGALPVTRPSLHGLVITDPTLNVFNLLAGTKNQAWVNLLDVVNSKIHNSKNVPILVPKTLTVPASWQLVPF